MRWPDDFGNWPYNDEPRPQPVRVTRPARAPRVERSSDADNHREFSATVPCSACGSDMPRLWFIDRCPACGAIQK